MQCPDCVDVHIWSARRQQSPLQHDVPFRQQSPVVALQHIVPVGQMLAPQWPGHWPFLNTFVGQQTPPLAS
jgi:hypothetical protein